MAEAVESGVILSFDEIQIFLYSMGITRLEGVYMPERTFSEINVLRALHHMSARGLIQAVGTEFTIREDVRRMLQVMGHPDATVALGQEESGQQAYFCYIAPDQIVVSEQYWKKRETLKLRMFTTEAFEAWREQMTEGEGSL